MRVTQMSSFNQPQKGNTPPRSINAQVLPPQKNLPVQNKLEKILSGFEKDDYILLGIIAVLIWEGCDDYILLAALGYLFFMGVR